MEKSLYEITGNISDVNIMLIHRADLTRLVSNYNHLIDAAMTEPFASAGLVNAIRSCGHPDFKPSFSK